MKNSILLFVFALLCSTISQAQSPIIEDFRTIVKEIPNNFANLKKDLDKDDQENNYKLFTTTLDDSPICSSFVFESATEGTFLILSYKVKDMDSMMFKIFNTMVPQYMKEINGMVATGKYTGEDFKENEVDVTQLKDLNGKVVLQYRSDRDEHRIMFFGAK